MSRHAIALRRIPSALRRSPTVQSSPKPPPNLANPWRPLFELPALLLWAVVAAVSWATAELWDLHAASFRWLAVGSLVMALTWLPGTVRGISLRDWLRGRPRQFSDMMHTSLRY